MFLQLILLTFSSFLGGLILNFMPCVFPVLSLKIISALKRGSSSKKELIVSGLSYTLGISSTMLVLSSIIFFVRKSGNIIGWGCNMQSPTVIILLIYCTFLIGLSFSGFYNISDFFLNTPLSTPNKYSQKRKILDNFFIGSLITLLATPCTAPFMATSISFALMQSNYINSLIIFQSLGLGIALPHLLLSFFPKTLSCLPKPGQWMESLSQLLSFPMYFSTIWLLWILVNQTNILTLFVVMILLVILLFIIWICKIISLKKIATKITIFFCFSITILAPIIYINRVSSINEALIPYSKVIFSEEKLRELLDNKKAVLVTIGAQWCLMCKVNEIILESNEIQRLLKKNDIVYMKGDLTKNNKQIVTYLEKFKRIDIPFYILYRSEKNYKILPQMLTQKMLIKFLNE